MLFKVERNDKVGRYAVATKRLEPGETFLEELPFAVGPKSCSPLICLGCYTSVDGSILCPQCGWPVCSVSCASNDLHAKAECIVFSTSKVTFQQENDPSLPSPQLECITPLRILLAKENNPDRWNEEVAMMESHCNKRKNLPDWDLEKINVVGFLLTKCKLKDRFTDELIHFVCGILEVNSFEIKTVNGTAIRGLFPKLSVLSHNCVTNTTHSIISSDSFKIIARATVTVESGEELYCSYTHSLAPTLTRREVLQTAKYFDCSCKRCSDPKELGTHLSSLKCTKCDNGIIISSNPLESEAQWKCTHCEFNITGDQVKRIYKVIENDIEQLHILPTVDCTLETAEKILRQYKSVLHPYHAYNLTIKHRLVQLYGRAPGYSFEELPDILLERKIELCQQILNVLNIIEPGNTRFRGLILYELHVPLMFYNKSRYESEEYDKAKFCSKMEEVAQILEEAIKILSLEDPSTPEGSIGQTGQLSLEQLKASIESLKSS